MNVGVPLSQRFGFTSQKLPCLSTITGRVTVRVVRRITLTRNTWNKCWTKAPPLGPTLRTFYSLLDKNFLLLEEGVSVTVSSGHAPGQFVCS